MLSVSPLILLLAGAPALACPGGEVACAEARTEASVSADPGQSARKADLIGANCAYTTAIMAQRVLSEGTPYTYVGRLIASGNHLDSRVAAPYTVGPTDGVHVVANEVVDLLTRRGLTSTRLQLTGKVLEVDGVTYFVPTDFTPSAS